MSQLALGAATILFVLCATTPTFGQESREAEIAAKQAHKATDLKPFVPSKPERVIADFRRGTIESPSGLFPVLDSPYRGGGFTLGAGYRQFFGDASFWDVKGAYSVKSYKLFEATTRVPLSDHGYVGLRVGWFDAPQVAYYGLGIDTTSDARTSFRLKETYAEGTLAFRPRRWIVLDGIVAYEDYSTEEGQGSLPSIETEFTPETAPGLGASPAYLHTHGTIGIDWRRVTRLRPFGRILRRHAAQLCRSGRCVQLQARRRRRRPAPADLPGRVGPVVSRPGREHPRR